MPMVVLAALCAGAAAPGGWWLLGRLAGSGHGHAQPEPTTRGAIAPDPPAAAAGAAGALPDAGAGTGAVAGTETVAVAVAGTGTGAADEGGDAGGDALPCGRPAVPVPRTAACERGEGYPACRWRVPHPAVADHLYLRWRHTENDRWWGRPALVALVLATARQYAARYPGEPLAIGDLDAPGPRHETHESGVDVDLYLPGMMAAENMPDGEQPDNYRGRDRLYVRGMRGRVEELARIVARCSDGRIRIYYNDWRVARRFRQWFEAQGLSSPFGRPMQRHNDLHRFHFHVTIDETLEPLPVVE